MKKAGELVHIDLHQLSKGITIKEPNNVYYLLGIIDDYSRLIWIEVLENKKSLTTMFATLKSLNMLKLHYNIETQCIMSDNGAEFGSGKFANNKEDHPFEVLLKEMNIKHIYTKPYKPQTNGKIERFWKTLKEDCIEDALYEDINDLKDELLKYIVYYNEHRPHSGIGGLIPIEMLSNNNNNSNNNNSSSSSDNSIDNNNDSNNIINNDIDNDTISNDIDNDTVSNDIINRENINSMDSINNNNY